MTTCCDPSLKLSQHDSSNEESLYKVLCRNWETYLCRVSTVREKVREKNIFSRSGNCQGILKFVRELQNLSKSQGKVREF